MPDAMMRTREATIDRSRADDATRSVPASLSSESPVRMGNELEVLRHEPGAVDLSRAAGGLPLLFGHDRMAPIGVVENVRIVNRRLEGVLRFGQSAKATEVWRDVLGGVLRHLSISYSVGSTAAMDGGYAVTQWAIYEASVVSVPADPTVGIGRSAPLTHHPQGTATMPTATMPTAQDRDATDSEIRATVAHHKLPAEFASGLIARGLDVDAANREVLNELYRRDQETGGNLNVRPMNYGTPQTEQRELMADALAARIGGPALTRENQYRHARVVDMARDLLEARGIRTTSMSGAQIVDRALHTTSDFPQLLQGTGQRVLGMAYKSYQGGIKRVCRASTAIDFRAKQRLMLGEAPTLLKVNEHSEFKYGSMLESKGSYAIDTFGRIFGITRRALVNDDLGAFGDMAVRLGRAASEFEAGFLVTLLTSNPTMSDSVALFHAASHGNLATGSGSALQLSSLTTARQAMRLQKGLDGSTPIDVPPLFLIVPAALETTAEQLLTQITPAQSSNVNPFAGKLELVVDPRLDAVSQTAWYLAADPATIDTIEYSYLESAGGPELFTEEGFEVDGLQMKVRLDFGAGVLDWRGLYKAVGA